MDEKRCLFSAGKTQPDILHDLKPLNVNKRFIASIEKRYGGGRKHTATSSDCSENHVGAHGKWPVILKYLIEVFGTY